MGCLLAMVMVEQSVDFQALLGWKPMHQLLGGEELEGESSWECFECWSQLPSAEREMAVTSSSELKVLSLRTPRLDRRNAHTLQAGSWVGYTILHQDYGVFRRCWSPSYLSLLRD